MFFTNLCYGFLKLFEFVELFLCLAKCVLPEVITWVEVFLVMKSPVSGVFMILIAIVITMKVSVVVKATIVIVVAIVTILTVVES